jgi:Capsular polysaccharide synthesis protein.
MTRDIFFRYWMEKDRLIEYFLIDYTLRYCVEHFDTLRKQVEEQPVTGNKRFFIRQFMNRKVDGDTIEQLQNDPVGIYKLSHKENYKEKEAGELTLYGQILADSFTLEMK